eukprot:jgi/Psemu1/262760/estExt_Genewise1Plus.C_8350018
MYVCMYVCGHACMYVCMYMHNFNEKYRCVLYCCNNSIMMIIYCVRYIGKRWFERKVNSSKSTRMVSWSDQFLDPPVARIGSDRITIWKKNLHRIEEIAGAATHSTLLLC